jgi:hypothetical protein
MKQSPSSRSFTWCHRPTVSATPRYAPSFAAAAAALQRPSVPPHTSHARTPAARCPAWFFVLRVGNVHVCVSENKYLFVTSYYIFQWALAEDDDVY